MKKSMLFVIGVFIACMLISGAHVDAHDSNNGGSKIHLYNNYAMRAKVVTSVKRGIKTSKVVQYLRYKYDSLDTVFVTGEKIERMKLLK